MVPAINARHPGVLHVTHSFFLYRPVQGYAKVYGPAFGAWTVELALYGPVSNSARRRF